MLGEHGAAMKAPPDLIKDATEATFMADVVEASRQTPVIVDFWATWCGPCRQLGPALEKAVTAAKGAVKLVKVDVDKNPRIASQLRIQSIPTVYAFVNGEPVDGFTGAVPDSQIKTFIDRLTGAAEPSDLEEVLKLAAESVAVGDIGGAAQGFAEALQIEPQNVKAIAGLARCYLMGGDAERAQEVVAMAPPDAKDAELESVKSALALAAAGPADVGQYERRLAADENDHAARLELARALASRGAFEAAAEQLFRIVEHDRDWNNGEARAQLLTVFDAAGPTSEVTKRGRRRLSSILFA
jgi:putative thioredoxin